MGDAGHPYARFKRSLARGSLTTILASAAAVERVRLDDALQVCAAVAREQPHEFDRYAARWLSAFIRERKHASLADIISAIGLLERLRRDGDSEEALRSLAVLVSL